MVEIKKMEIKSAPTVAAVKKVAATPKKLIPRSAQKAAAQPAVQPVAPAAARPAKKVDVELEAINARNKKALSEALLKAQAVKITQPLGKPASAKPQKPAKALKAKKVKLVRDSFAMPETEYAMIAALKKRLAGFGKEVKKSELLRGGIANLTALSDAQLQAVMNRVERIKTGRPHK